MGNNNKTIFIIAVVIVILVTLIAILYTNKVKPKPAEATNYDIKAYKSHLNENEASGHSYGECMIDSGAKALLIAEFQKITTLDDGSKVNNQSINGTYRVDYKDKMIAFDDEKGIVYVEDKNALYYYNSPLYEKVISYCD